MLYDTPIQKNTQLLLTFYGLHDIVTPNVLPDADYHHYYHYPERYSGLWCVGSRLRNPFLPEIKPKKRPMPGAFLIYERWAVEE
jgi:hypothetical protein